VKRTVAINDHGLRIGQGHQRARLTDHEVFLLVELRAAGVSWRKLAAKFEISVRHARDIVAGRKRAQTPVGFREVCA
jgi:hypothetical protein